MPTVRKLLLLAAALCLLAPAAASADAQTSGSAHTQTATGSAHTQAATGSAHTQTATGSAHTQTATAGGVTATLSWQGQDPMIKHLRLEIAQGGSVVYDQPVSSTACGGYCGPAGAQSVQVLDLTGSGQLDVLLQLYSQGAHCCFIDQVFSPSAALGGYVMAERNFENSGAVLRDLDHNGQTEFVSANNAFAYEFTDFAESGLPVQIFGFTGLKFVDLTRSYPSLIRHDASLWWRAYRRDHDSGRVGLIAAWAADQYNLGRGRTASRTLAAQVSADRISARFVRRLKSFLRHTGYIR